MNTEKLTATDRTVLNRFCLEIATHIRFSTNCIRRPFTEAMLRAAFSEMETQTAERIEKLREKAKNYAALSFEGPLSDYFGGKPSEEEYAAYVEELIEQETQALKTRESCYTVSVDCEFSGEEARALYTSFHPRATFGYSNQLHDECRAELTPSLRLRLQKTELCKRPSFDCESRTFGSFFLEELCGFFEDTALFAGDRMLSETISHERIYDLYLTEKECRQFETFEGREQRNRKILNKLGMS